jgi:hypothetical protein
LGTLILFDSLLVVIAPAFAIAAVQRTQAQKGITITWYVSLKWYVSLCKPQMIMIGRACFIAGISRPIVAKDYYLKVTG